MKKVLPLLCRWILAVVFIVAAYPKLAEPQAFAEAIFRYQILPYELVNLAAILMPGIELIAAVALVACPRHRKAAVVLIFLMLAFFTAAIAANVYRGINIACGCFSVSGEGSHLGWMNLARNALLLGMCVVVWVDARRARL